jgi:pilus assembly protein FimV
MEHVTTRIGAAALSVLLLLISAGAWPLGLGNIEVKSTLNEPLQARIELSSLQDGDLDRMQVQLASARQFKRAGIQRPFQLSKLKFTAVQDGSDSGHINVTTRDAVVEPFLNFLIEVTWPRGRIVREYTLLLDPPVYGAAISSKAKMDLAEIQARALQEQPAPEPAPAPKRAQPAPVTPPAAPAPAVQPGTSTSVAPAPAQTPTPTESTVAAAPAPAPAASSEPAPKLTMTAPAPMPMPSAAGGDLAGPYDVKYGDTLWSLANRYRPDSSVSIQRMMLAMLSANPDAFNIPNINALRAGTVLHIPDVSQFGAADRQVVLAEVNRQHDIWQQYRQGLAAVAPKVPEGASVAVVEPEPTATATETETPVPPEQAATGIQSADDDGTRLALVSGGQGTEGVGSASSDSSDAARTRRELVLAQEEADAKTREADELSSRVTELQGIVEDLQRAIQLRDDNLAALQAMLAKTEQEADALRAAAEQVRADAAGTGATSEPQVEAVPEPVVEATPEPVVEAVPEPVVEAVPEPVVEAVPEPVVEAVPEPVVEAVLEPVVEATPEPEPAKVLPPPAPPPSFIETVLESLPVDPVLLGAGVGGLLVILGGAALWRRRRTADDIEDMGELDAGALDESDLLYDEDGEPYLPHDAGEEAAVAELEGTDLSDERAEPQAQAAEEESPQPEQGDAAVAEDSEDDPLTEVNVYLAYERYDQAEELVRSAIAQYPSRHEYKLRLLEVFYAAKDLGNFESSARELQDAVGADGPLLAEAQKMWQDMSPGRELFSEAESTVPEDQDVVFDVTGGGADAPATMPASSIGGADESSSVDFDLGFQTDDTTSEAASGDSGLDFDLGFDQAAGTESQAEPGLDLDLTSIGEFEGGGEDAGGGSSVDFDLGAEATAEDGSGSSSMDFDLTGMDSSLGEPRGAATETPLPERVSRDDDDLDFDLERLGEGTLMDSQVPPEAPPGAAPQPPEIADGDDGALDFDLDGIGGESEGVDSGAMSLDAEFTALDLNLDAADAGAASSDSQLSALDDDLSSALGFDIGSDSVDAGGLPDDALDFGLELADGDAGADVAGGADLNLSLDDDFGGGEVSEETAKLDLGAAIPGDDLDEALDTVKLQSPEIDAADSAISDLGLDLNLDMDVPDGGEPSSAVDTAFGGIFDEDAAAASQDDMALSMDGSDLIPPTPPPSPDADADFPEIDLDFDAEKSQDAAASDEYESTQFMLRDMPSSEDSGGSGEGHTGSTLMLGGGLTGEVDEVQTKLDLAQAYIDMGDTDGAKGIIDEVIAEGNAAQKQAAMGLLGKLASS